MRIFNLKKKSHVEDRIGKSFNADFSFSLADAHIILTCHQFKNNVYFGCPQDPSGKDLNFDIMLRVTCQYLAKPLCVVVSRW